MPPKATKTQASLTPKMDRMLADILANIGCRGCLLSWHQGLHALWRAARRKRHRLPQRLGWGRLRIAAKRRKTITLQAHAFACSGQLKTAQTTTAPTQRLIRQNLTSVLLFFLSNQKKVKLTKSNFSFFVNLTFFFVNFEKCKIYLFYKKIRFSKNAGLLKEDRVEQRAK